MDNFDDIFDDNDLLELPQSSSQKAFLRILNGQICSVLREPREGYSPTEITNFKTKETRTAYVRPVQAIKGWLTGLRSKLHETDAGTFAQLEFTFTGSSGRQAVLSIPPKSTFVARFAKTVENMNLSEPIRVSVSPDYHNPGKYRVFFDQHGNSVPQKYTKETPHDLPAWERNELTGEYDDRNYWAFLHNILKQVAIPAAENNVRRLIANELLPDGPPATQAREKDGGNSAVPRYSGPSLTNSPEEIDELIESTPPKPEPEYVKQTMSRGELDNLAARTAKPAASRPQPQEEDYDDDIPF
jgi:hypothetical protein